MTETPRYQFHHLHLVCTDLAASERWFVGGVGAEVIERRESRGMPTTELRLGGVRLLLRAAGPGEDIAPARRHFGADHFGLQVEHVDATVETLRARGVEIAIEPRDSPTNRVAFIRGPDNVLIELVQPR